MNNEELEKIKKDATTFVDELKDKIHEQNFEIKRLKEKVNYITTWIEEHIVMTDKELEEIRSLKEKI